MRPTGRNSIEAICTHIQALLSTRVGTVPYEPSFGLPDLLPYYDNLSENLNTISVLVQQQLYDFEPRLSNVSVTAQKSNMPVCIHLKIKAHCDGSVVCICCDCDTVGYITCYVADQ